MLAKIVPYVPIGYIQMVLVLAASALFFQLPIWGSMALLLVALRLFIARNLALGITFSTVAANQMQANQFAQFTLLPSLLLSGFMFPFKGMPLWAQWAGQIIPATHAMRVVCGLLLKGNRLPDIFPELWPTALFALAAIMIAVWFYRETLD
jgi:ABC-2 type transport system permease protein